MMTTDPVECYRCGHKYPQSYGKEIGVNGNWFCFSCIEDKSKPPTEEAT